jgi:S1-C subfamily serine protease
VKEGRPTFEARVLEDDPAHDLALLQIAKSRTFPYVSICSTCAILVGETAVAIGNPYGLGDTVTVGIVSALGRSASLPTGYTIKNLIQTDASINLGNSGGALLNLDGELMGINSSIHPSAKGIAFSVPGDAVLELLDRNLGARARPARPNCPVTADDGGAPLATLPPAPTYEEPTTPPPAYVPEPPAPAPSTSVARPKRSPIGLMLRTAADGVLVSSVTAQSSADIAGIVGGDLILDVDGKAYTSAPDLADLFQKAAPGRTFVLDLRRGGRTTNAIIVVPFR